MSKVPKKKTVSQACSSAIHKASRGIKVWQKWWCCWYDASEHFVLNMPHCHPECTFISCSLACYLDWVWSHLSCLVDLSCINRSNRKANGFDGFDESNSSKHLSPWLEIENIESIFCQNTEWPYVSICDHCPWRIRRIRWRALEEVE